jgi:hypothetical protein
VTGTDAQQRAVSVLPGFFDALERGEVEEG